MAILSIVSISAMLSAIPLDVKAFTADPTGTGLIGGPQHREINKILENLDFSDKALEIINRANDQQDRRVSNNLEKPECHALRKPCNSSIQAFDDLRNYINKTKYEVKGNITHCRTEEALKALGRALHALQDFYSHSNYVDEFFWWQQAEIDKALMDPSYPLDPALLQRLRLPRNDVAKKEDDTHEGYTHKENHKDNPGSPRGIFAFRAAKENAIWETYDFVEKIRDQFEEAPGYWHKLILGITPRPPPMERSVPESIPGPKALNPQLKYKSGAVNLTVFELLPHGVVFVSSEPEPFAIENVTLLVTPDNPPMTLVQWRFVSDEPIGPMIINYTIEITEEAITNPSVPILCADPVPGCILYDGWIIEIDINGTEYRSLIDGQQFTRISTGVGGIVVPVDKFGLLAPYIALASTILVATAATAIYVKHVKRRKKQ